MTLDRTVLAAFALLISLTSCGRLPAGVAQDPAGASLQGEGVVRVHRHDRQDHVRRGPADEVTPS